MEALQGQGRSHLERDGHVARRQAPGLIGMRNQREVATALSLFAADNQDRYPDSVATLGFDDNFTWQDPTKMIGQCRRTSNAATR